MTKPKRQRVAYKHLRLCDGSLRYADKDYNPRDIRKPISRALNWFYIELGVNSLCKTQQQYQ